MMGQITGADLLAIRSQAASAKDYAATCHANADSLSQAYLALQVENVKLRAKVEEASFEAADMATASAQGFRDGVAAAGATIATLKGQRAVLCSLLRECLPAIQDLAEETMQHDTEASAYSLIIRIESALDTLAEDEVKEGES